MTDTELADLARTAVLQSVAAFASEFRHRGAAPPVEWAVAQGFVAAADLRRLLDPLDGDRLQVFLTHLIATALLALRLPYDIAFREEVARAFAGALLRTN